MKVAQFLKNLDDQRVIAAIRAAEGTTSGEIRVFVSSKKLGGKSVEELAARQFEKLGMTRTAERNAVLLFFVPRDQEFAVIGDRGIHEKCRGAVWSETAARLREELARGEFTDAVVHAIERLTVELATHFPRQSADRNELSDQIGRD
jgi:uncharacterized membrane protein